MMTSAQPDYRTRGNYAFPIGHVFAITNPEERLYQFVSRSRDVVTIRPVAPPHLDQIISGREFDDLVAAGKIDPRDEDNNPSMRAARIRHHAACLDLPEAEHKVLSFHWRLCRRIHDMHAAGEISMTDEALRPAISQVAAALTFGEHAVAEEISKGNVGRRRGSMKTMPAARERRLKARKAMMVFEAPSPSTVRAYIRRLVDGEWDIRELRDRRKGRSGFHAPRLATAQSYQIMQRWVMAYLDRSRPTAAMLHKLMIGSCRIENVSESWEHENLDTFASVNAKRVIDNLPPLQVPSLSTFERAIRRIDKFQVVCARHGHKAARAQFHIVGRRAGPLAAGERVAIDNWLSQIMVLKLPKEFWSGLDDENVNALLKRRLSVCIAICEATKVVLGIRLSLTPNEQTSLEALEMVCRDRTDVALAAGCHEAWNHALTPEEVVSDSGSEFIGYRFRAAVTDLGSHNEIGKAGHPDARACIERFNGTLDRQLMPLFQGRTFSGIAEKGDYDPAAVANVTAEVLGKALVRWVVDVYHNLPHAGLGGETPNGAWARLSEEYGVRPPPSATVTRAVFGFNDLRQIQNRGIRFMGLFYRRSADNRLAKLRQRIGQKKVRIRVDLRNLGAISVCADESGANWFTVHCDFDWMEGVSANEWLATVNRTRQRHADLAKLGEPVVLAALQDIRQMARGAAVAAGIGPSTMTAEMLLKHEQEACKHLDIRPAEDRGTTFEGIIDAPWNSCAASVDEGGGEPVPVNEDEADKPAGSVSRRRRGVGSGFLKEGE